MSFKKIKENLIPTLHKSVVFNLEKDILAPIKNFIQKFAI